MTRRRNFCVAYHHPSYISGVSWMNKHPGLIHQRHRRIVAHTLSSGPLFAKRWTSYRQISLSIEAARLDVILFVSFLNSTGISAELLPSCLSNFRAIERYRPESRSFESLWDLGVRYLTSWWIQAMGHCDSLIIRQIFIGERQCYAGNNMKPAIKRVNYFVW